MAAMAPQATTPLENVPGLGEGLVEKLTAAGITTVEALADMTPEQLEAIPGIGPKTVEKISIAVNNYFSSLEAGEAPAETPEFLGDELPAEALQAGEFSAESPPPDETTSDVGSGLGPDSAGQS